MFDLVPNGSSWIGTVGGTLTTICWLPQVVRLIRYREAHAISLPTNLILIVGQMFWLAYGIAINDWPVIGANVVSIALTSIIIAMKLRYG